MGKLATFVEQEIRRICETTIWTIGALNVQADWSRSYYVGSVGDMSVDTVLKYIELGQA